MEQHRYRLTWVVPEKGLLNGCVCVCVCVHDELLSVLFVGDYDQLLLTYYNSTLVTLKVNTEHQ